MVIPLVWKIIIAVVIVGLLIVTARTIVVLFRKNERMKEIIEHGVKVAAENEAKITLLTRGEAVNMDRAERLMALSALEYVPFREGVELPETKHNVRQVYRRLREKLRILARRDAISDSLDITAPDGPEVEEDDETKEAPK
jgi:hypothetical protein